MFYTLDASMNSITEMSSYLAQSNMILIIPFIISILTPVFLAYLNNKHQIKMKRIELLFQKKQETYLQFSESYYSYVISDSIENFRALESAANKCRLLCRNREFESSVTNLVSFAECKASKITCDKFFKECLDFLHEDLKSEEKYFFLK